MSMSDFTPIRLAVALLISALLISGCSNPDSSRSPTEFEPDPVVPDPVVQNSTRITFDITVPAYVSNALQIRLTWGQKDVKGTWVGDEFWTVSDDFPTDTQFPLRIEFNDGNGALTLGSFEKEFKTGTNASESHQIAADQFDTDRWDRDGDGASNIDELIAGTDPLVDETAELEVLEFYGRYARPEVLSAIRSVAESYESSIPTQIPYSVQTEVIPSPTDDLRTGMTTSTLIIDIDETGAGSYSEVTQYRDLSENRLTRRIGTRAETDNSVTWTGTYFHSSYSAAVSDDMEFTTETRVIDEQTRSQNGSVERQNNGSSARYAQTISYTLIGTLIDDASMCEPASGSIVHEERYPPPPDPVQFRTTVTKGTDDQYWTIRTTNLADGLVQQEYLARSLGTTFHCGVRGSL